METIRARIQSDAISWTTHVATRMIKRSIAPLDVLSVLRDGHIIEHYPEDYPFPSCLVFAIVDGRPIHVVCSIGDEQLYVITAYQPDAARWDSTFTKRIDTDNKEEDHE
uniref:DUF4258 domain-containing protein n=1 Tax=Selenomonas sp. TAMA-11512 TaxID=3095337 RepID=UPI00403F1034